MTPSKTLSVSYFIVYGFGENPSHGRFFHAAMKQAGFVLVDDFAAADIIVAHSGGCYEMPDTTGKQVFWFQPAAAWQSNPYATHYQKTVLEYRRHKQLRLMKRLAWKWRLNLTQLAAHPRRTHRYVRLARTYKLALPATNARRLVVIASRDDPWSNRIRLAHLPVRPDSTLLSMAGTHDEVWTRPEPCVGIIRATYET